MATVMWNLLNHCLAMDVNTAVPKQRLSLLASKFRLPADMSQNIAVLSPECKEEL
jgi:hypothetical protein